MIRVRQIKVSIDNDNSDFLLRKIEKKLNTKVIDYKIIKKSIDARKKEIFFVYEVDCNVLDEDKVISKASSNDIFLSREEKYTYNITGSEKINDRIIVVGSGPSGLFCAYFLSEAGYKVLVLEQGEKMEDRIKSVDEFFSSNKLNILSNIQFGEGGAGTFSDGKLNTLVKDKKHIGRRVFEIFVENGAPEEIITNNVFLAIGHSARDTYYMLNDNNIKMLPKPFAVGLRIIHKEEQISKDLYGANYKLLPPANYKLTYTTKEGRGVYSFCMCPGGYVINASSENGYLSINGMSDYKRDSKFSNSALVVTVNSKDYGEGLFDGLNFQKELERKTYEIGNGNIPVQRYEDFVNNTVNEVKTDGIKGNYVSKDLNLILPEYISSSIKEAMPHFSKIINSFEKDAIFLGTESRTSSPLTILRNEDGMSNIEGIYPVGEGAGYSGGITTSAVDGIIQAENFAKRFKSLD